MKAFFYSVIELALLFGFTNVISGQQNSPPNRDLPIDQYVSNLSRLANDADVNSRVSAASILTEGLRAGSHTTILWSLLKDSELLVQGKASLAVSAIATDGDLSLEESVKLEDFLKKRVHSMRNFDSKDSDPLRAMRNWVTCCDIYALNTLYMTRPLISVQDYIYWQDQELARAVCVNAIDRSTLSEDMDNLLLGMLASISNPDSIESAVKAVCEHLPTLSKMKIERTLKILWKHSLVGVDKPMSYVLAKTLNSQLGDIEKRLLEDNPSLVERQEMEFILGEIKRSGRE